MQSTVPSSRPKRCNFIRAFLHRFTSTKDSATQKHDDLLNSSVVCTSPPISGPSPKAVSPTRDPTKDPKFFAGVTRADGKDDSTLANKSLSDSATQKYNNLLNSPAVRPSPPIPGPSPKAISPTRDPTKDPKFFAGVTRADGRDDSAFASKSLSFV